MFLTFVLFLFFVCDAICGKNSRVHLPVSGKFPPCDNKIIISYDSSNMLSKEIYKAETDFLTRKIFNKKWTNYDNLILQTYYGQSVVERVKSREEMKGFFVEFAPQHSGLNLCNALLDLGAFDSRGANILMFVSHLKEDNYRFCLENARRLRWQANSITFVVLNRENVDVKNLQRILHDSKFIYWDIEKDSEPDNWNKYFLEAYGCNPRTSYPECNNKVLIGYDKSQLLKTTDYELERSFLTKFLLPKWTKFNQLAIWSYANTVTQSDFGKFFNFNEIKDFIANDKWVNDEDPVLCNTFVELAKIELTSLSVILFVSTFDTKQVNSICQTAINTLNAKLNSMAFVTLTTNVNATDLKSYFNQAKIIKWQMNMSAPDNWESKFSAVYGCPIIDYSIPYPCDPTSKIIVAYDISNYLNETGWENQINFLRTHLFTKEWNHFEKLALMGYNAEDKTTPITDFGRLKNLDDIESFVQSLQQSAIQYPSFCEAIKNLLTIDSNQSYVVLLATQFVKGRDDGLLCQDAMKNLTQAISGITVIAMSDDVSEKHIREYFKDMKYIQWYAETEEEPKHWRQTLWHGFGCDGLSPLIRTTFPPMTIGTTESKNHQNNPPPRTTIPPKTVGIGVYIGIFLPLSILLFWAIIICLCLYRRQHLQKRESLMNELIDGRVQEKVVNRRLKKTVDDPWEIRPENILINYENKLGSGAFGDVYTAKLIGDAGIKRVFPDLLLLSKFRDCKVAIKTVSLFADEFRKSEFQQEINFMKTLQFHPHLVCFLGHVQESTGPLLVLEYCSNGDLLQCLRRNKEKFNEENDLKVKNLVSFAWQISSGLEYLTSLNLIHRDVAARNVLLDKDNVCKISDFGLCRTVDSQIYSSKGGKLPIRWMAIESLTVSEYSMKSDVWSYGVLLFELFSFGRMPYAGMENAEILPFLQEGKRLDRPEYCIDEIYDLMLTCWKKSPNDRPTFTEICQAITKLLEAENAQYNYVDAVENDDTFELHFFNSDSSEVNV